jgi:hypothetical protein
MKDENEVVGKVDRLLKDVAAVEKLEKEAEGISEDGELPLEMLDMVAAAQAVPSFPDFLRYVKKREEGGG